MKKTTHGSLFSGIGGFDLAAEWMGWENMFHCEINPFAQKVLNYYWPNAISYDDITKTDFTIHRGTIDILTGGFPCQPYSTAGKQLGKADDRHLWPEMLRAIREIAPRYIVGENVRGLVSWNGGMVFDEVQSDLEAAGYEVLPFLLPASSVGARHDRKRIWFIAHANKVFTDAIKPENGHVTKEWDGDTKIGSKNRISPELVAGIGCSSVGFDFGQGAEPAIINRNDGVSFGLVAEAFSGWIDEANGAAGNAVVPQVVYQIFKAIEQYEKEI